MPRPIKAPPPTPPRVVVPASDCESFAAATVAEWESAGRHGWDKYEARFLTAYPDARAVLTKAYDRARRARLMRY